MAGRNGLAILKSIVEQSTRGAKGFENILSKEIREVKCISARYLQELLFFEILVTGGGNGSCICELRVTEDHQNRTGTLHGGLTCTLVDSVSTWALLGSEEPVAGVSVDLSVTFMKGAKVGEDIIIDAKTLKRGKRLAFLSVDIKNKQDGTLLAQGKHTKFVG